MNKTPVLITAMICLTVLIVILIVITGDSEEQHPVDVAEQLIEAFEKEYGVKATVQLEVENSSKNQAELITNWFAEVNNSITDQRELDVGESTSKWYTAVNADKGIDLRVYYED